MSHTSLSTAPASSSNFLSIFDAALSRYKKKTKNDLLTHRLTAQLETCNSPSAILAVLEEQYQVQQFIQSRSGDGGSKKWLNVTAKVLCAFSTAIGEGAKSVFPPAKLIFAGVGLLLAAAGDVDASQDALAELFERIENFFGRLETYAEVPPTHQMIDLIVKIMVEVLDILAIATKDIKRRLAIKYMNKVLGKTDIEDALKRLDKLTHEESLMATAQVLKVAHRIEDKVTSVDENVKSTIADGKEAREEAREVNKIVRHVADGVTQIKGSQLRQDLRTWLSPPDPTTNHNIACGARHEGSAEWFFRGSIFKEWESTGSLLWVHGKPGSGKSVLCSTIIKDIIILRDRGLASAAYFYFDFRNTSKQNRRGLLPSIVSQLSARSDPYRDILCRLHLDHDSGAQAPSEDALIKCLKDMVKLPDQPPVYVIIDALDECPNSGMPSPRVQVLDLLKGLIELSLPNLHLCVTSRREIDIRNVLEPLASRRVSLHDQSGQKKDIVAYVNSVVDSDPMMRSWRDEDKRLVIETLSERANGMFRWVSCQLEALRHCIPSSVRQMLEELPETLDETYERILREIHNVNREHAHRLLQCLTVAVRPLRVAELTEILAIDFGAATHDRTSSLNAGWRWEDQERAVLSTCSSLINIADENGIPVVHFSHFTVKEFLTSPRLATSSVDVSRFHIQLEPAHTILAKACLDVLLRLDNCVDKRSLKKTFPLARYAAEHWVTHAQFESVSLQIRDGMEHLFDPEKPYFSAWRRVYDIDVQPFPTADLKFFALKRSMNRNKATPLYYAALCGFYDLVEFVITKHPQLVNAKGGFYTSPLAAALGRRDFKMAQLLYQHGADVDVQGCHERTLLYAASIKGAAEIAQWLLSHSADPNVRVDAGGARGWTPLHSAALYGYPELIRTLLQFKADNDTKDSMGQISSHLPSSERRPNAAGPIPKRQDVDVNAQDMDGFTPLHLASGGGKLEVVRLLVEHGADIDVKDKAGWTAFQFALAKGYSEITKLLSEHKSN